MKVRPLSNSLQTSLAETAHSSLTASIFIRLFVIQDVRFRTSLTMRLVRDRIEMYKLEPRTKNAMRKKKSFKALKIIKPSLLFKNISV